MERNTVCKCYQDEYEGYEISDVYCFCITISFYMLLATTNWESNTHHMHK